jgi:hypothetical protein
MASKPAQSRRASRRAAQTGNVLDLRSGLFERPDPAAIASLLKRVAQKRAGSDRDPYRSAMSMLTFYMNRERGKLSKGRWRTLELAKQHLRAQFHRPAQ